MRFFFPQGSTIAPELYKTFSCCATCLLYSTTVEHLQHITAYFYVCQRTSGRYRLSYCHLCYTTGIINSPTMASKLALKPNSSCLHAFVQFLMYVCKLSNNDIICKHTHTHTPTHDGIKSDIIDTYLCQWKSSVY